LTEAEESDRRVEEFRARSQLFIDSLDVDEVIAQLLVTEGFSTIEEVAFVPVEELSAIEGFDDDVANELRERGRQYLEQREAELNAIRKEAGVSDEVAEFEGLTPEMVVALGENEVKSLDDLADLASDELREIVGEVNLSEDATNKIIMAARAHWFEDEDAANVEAEAETPAEEAPEETAEVVEKKLET
jgi:N utilization substance protein A